MFPKKGWLIALAIADLVTAVALVVAIGWPWGVVGALVTLGISAAVYTGLLRPMLRAQAVLEQGEPAEATVLKVWDTGWTVNDDPQVGLLLAVRPPGGAPFQAKAKCVVSRLVVGTLQPGAVVPVRYDPEDRQQVQLVPGVAGRPPARDAASRLAELEGLRRQGLVTEEEYQAKRQQILGEL